MSTILSFQDVTVTNGNRILLDALRFTVCKGEILVIVGESGSGKTTLLSALFPCPMPGLTSWAVPKQGVYLKDNFSSKMKLPPKYSTYPICGFSIKMPF